MSNISKNFTEVYNDLLKTEKRTKIAKKIGYTTTTQLQNSLTGVALISTKAIQNLVKNFSVNPMFLFTGYGAMYIK